LLFLALFLWKNNEEGKMSMQNDGTSFVGGVKDTIAQAIKAYRTQVGRLESARRAFLSCKRNGTFTFLVELSDKDGTVVSLEKVGDINEVVQEAEKEWKEKNGNSHTKVKYLVRMVLRNSAGEVILLPPIREEDYTASLR
jgi:hypothetical protein